MSWRSSSQAVLVVVCLAIFTDMLLFGMLIPIMDPFLRQFGEEYTSDKWQTILYVMYSVGLFVATPLFGVISDRWQTRQIPMLVGLAALAGSTLLFALSNSVSLVLMARLLQGISASATWVVGFAMLTDTFTAGKLAMAISTAMTFHSLGFFVGPLIGGFMSDWLGLRSPFYLCVALCVLDFIMRLAIKAPKPVGKSKAEQVGIFSLLIHPRIALILGVVLLYASSFSAIEALYSHYMESHFHFSSSLNSLSMLGFILPSTLNSYLMSWLGLHHPRYKIMTVGVFLHAMAAPLPVVRPALWTLIAGSVLFSLTASTMMSPATPELISIVDELGGASYARIYALINMTYSLGMVVGPIIVGAIKTKTSYPTGMSFISACCVIYAPLFYFLQVRLRPSPPKTELPMASTSDLSAMESQTELVK